MNSSDTRPVRSACSAPSSFRHHSVAIQTLPRKYKSLMRLNIVLRNKAYDEASLKRFYP